MDVHNQHPNHDLTSFKQAQVVVIMVPFPAHSHISQFLILSCLVSSYKIPVHFACSTTYMRQAKQRFNGTDHLENAKIHFHEYPNPPLHLDSPIETYFLLRDPVATLLHKISPTAERVIVVHDFFMTCVVQDIATISNAKFYAFNPISVISSFFYESQLEGRNFKLEELEGLLPSTEGPDTPQVLSFASLQSQFLEFTAGRIFNSCRSIEGTYIDLFSKEEIIGNKQVWAVGPLNLLGAVYDNKNSNNQHKCLEWLDKQAPNSVLYVSFGTTTSMTNEQIKELAMGLEQSEQNFIWALRGADEDIFGRKVERVELPQGYEERVKEVGLVVRDWAPQLEILAHPSIGGFMSHCGWNSCIESISMGVPLAAWPIQYDQPQNAFLVTDVLKVGLVVNQPLKQDEIVTSSTIAKAAKRLMASKEGEEIRKRAEELGGATLQSVKEGGVSSMELDSFIAHITT